MAEFFISAKAREEIGYLRERDGDYIRSEQSCICDAMSALVLLDKGVPCKDIEKSGINDALYLLARYNTLIIELAKDN